MRAWKAANKEKYAELQRRWKEANPRYHHDWMREYRKTPEGAERHRREERERRTDKRREFMRLCASYKITVEDFAWRIYAQGFACAGCKQSLRFDKKTHIDHDHSTREVRGILCHWCNLVLGNAKDKPETLRRLASYLESQK